MSLISHPAEKPGKAFLWPAKESPSRPEAHQNKWWRWLGWEALLLAAIVATIYFARLSDMSVRGEESRWATVAMEMIRTGDWVVPRQQGAPFLSRPPLGSWFIALTTLVRADCDVWAVRLPAVLATLLTSLLIYGYSRAFLSRFGAFTAALAYATMGQVLQLGRVGETEAVFTLLVSASLLIWHRGYAKQWPDICTWIAGYGLTALGALAKGPQAPIYFVTVTSVFLIWRWEWRRLLSWSHLVGVGVFAAIIACWQVPFFLKLGWPAVKGIWASDTAMRFSEIRLQAVLEHMLTYPVEILICTLPWSLFLLGYLSKRLRRQLHSDQPSGISDDSGPKQMAPFLVTCLAVTFPSCWLIPGAHGRYFIPLYPCLAPLIGLMVERCVLADPHSTPRRIWRNSLACASLGMVGFALAMMGASWLGFPKISLLIQEKNFSLLYSGITLAFAAFFWWCRGRFDWRWQYVAMSGLAIFLGLTYDTVVMNFIVRKNGITFQQVSELKQQLPNDRNLVSFGPIHHVFAYHFRQPIELRDWPMNGDDRGGEVAYFCFERNEVRPLPFPWEKIAEISCDRDRTLTPEEVVIVGRRLITETASGSLTSSRSSP